MKFTGLYYRLRAAFDRRIQSILLYFSYPAIKIMKLIAETGKKTDLCLENGFLPVLVHYYQPIPDIYDLEYRKVWEKQSNMSGIRFRGESYITLIREMAGEFSHECRWPNNKSADDDEFYLNNNSFSYGCAASLHCMIRNNRPKKVVEIGSGNSSKIISSALHLNHNDGTEIDYTIIDPYCKVGERISRIANIVNKKVELVDLAVFLSLNKGDILFVDSSHVSKIGSDVNFLILDVLPVLNIGVHIHFHDIPMPFEYNMAYSKNSSFRMFWTESYLLQAFLICNRDFEITLPLEYLQKYYMDDLRAAFPESVQAEFGWVSGSFWIKRVSNGIECETLAVEGHG